MSIIKPLQSLDLFERLYKIRISIDRKICASFEEKLSILSLHAARKLLCNLCFRLDIMSGNGRRRNSKWDLEEDILPENHHDNAHSNKIRSSFHEHDSRDHMSGTRDLQRAENMNEEIPVFEGDGHFSTRKSTAPDEGRQQSRAYSSKNRGRSYRSRSRSKSRSRSPARNPRRQSSFNDQSNKSGHSAPLCRDFAAGRCRKGDHCLFAHTNLGRHLDRRVGGDRERDEKSLRSHHDSSGRRSTNICTDFVKGRCRRGASCKYSHHDSGSDEFRKWTVDGSHRDGYNYTHNENVYAENKSPNDRQPKHNMNGNHEVRGDAKWSDTTSLRSMPKSPGWDDHIVQQASADIRYGPAFMQTDAPSDYKQQSVSTFVDGATGTTNNESFSVNDLWKSQPAFPLNPMNEGMQMPYYQAAVDTKPAEGQSQRTFPSHQPVINSKPDMSNALVSQAASGPTTSQSSFFSEQLLQIPHLSTTLSQLYAAIPQGVMMDGGSNLPNSSASVLPPVSGASVLTNPITKPTQQYDPMCDGIETKMARTMNEFVSSSVTPSLPAVPTSLVTGETTTSDYLIGLSGDDLGHQNLDSNQQSGAVGKEEQNGGETGKETNEGEEEEVGEDMAVNDEKKAKDVKEIRPFKFALAEYVKELLKPTWKEGKLNKEVYKTIVKKVVEKVTESIQEAHIPRTKEKIDQYLSFSKPKLTKLVQAYVERYKKN